MSSQAKGKHEVVKAQLEARRDPGPRRDAQVRREQGEAGYNVAVEKCDDLRHDSRDACRKRARQLHERRAQEVRQVVKAGARQRSVSSTATSLPGSGAGRRVSRST